MPRLTQTGGSVCTPENDHSAHNSGSVPCPIGAETRPQVEAAQRLKRRGGDGHATRTIMNSGD